MRRSPARGVGRLVTFHALVVLAIVVAASAGDLETSGSLCPPIGANLFGNLLLHLGCRLPLDDGPLTLEDKMKPTTSPPSESSRMKPQAVKPAVPEWLQELTDHLLTSTHIANNMGQEVDADVEEASSSSPDGIVDPAESEEELRTPQCCQVETRIVFPLFARSMTSGKLVRLAQDMEPSGIQQPVVYRHCLSEKTSIVRGRCHQSNLPRIFYVGEGFPYKQDLVLVPSNCDCIVNIGRPGDDDDDDVHLGVFRRNTTTTALPTQPESEVPPSGSNWSTSSGSLLVEGSGSGSGSGAGSDPLIKPAVAASGIDSLLQEDGFIRLRS